MLPALQREAPNGECAGESAAPIAVEESPTQPDSQAEGAPAAVGILARLRAILCNPVVLCVFLTKLLTSIANSMASAAMPLIFKDSFKLNEAGLGLVMAISGASNAVAGALFVGPLTSYLRPAALVTLCLVGIAASFAGAAALSPGNAYEQDIAAALQVC